MKKTILNFFLLFVLMACSSPNTAINTFLKEEIKTNEKDKKLVLIENQKLPQQVLNKVGWKLRKFDSLTGKIEYTKTFFNDNELNYFNYKYKNDTLIVKWKERDFKDFNFKVLSVKNGLKDIENYNKSIGNSPFSFYIYNISKSFFTKDKKTCFFYLSKSMLYSEDCNDCNIYVMKKEKRKWVLIKTIPTR